MCQCSAPVYECVCSHPSSDSASNHGGGIRKTAEKASANQTAGRASASTPANEADASNAASICKHNRIRSACKQCGGLQLQTQLHTKCMHATRRLRQSPKKWMQAMRRLKHLRAQLHKEQVHGLPTEGGLVLCSRTEELYLKLIRLCETLLLAGASCPYP